MVTIYVEGGAPGALKASCRQGFKKFFEKSGLKGKMPSVVACGSRNDAYNDFCTALARAKNTDFVVLLVDSEAPVTVNQNQVWQHVREKDKWQQPDAAKQEHLHFMAECMEAWFMADKDYLKSYFGQGFDTNKLPDQPDIEKMVKADWLSGLKKATKNCKTKDGYGKSQDSFKILAKIDPHKVIQCSPFAARLLSHLKTCL